MSTWITSIVTNSARMYLRKRSRPIHVPLDEPTCDEQEHSMSERLADNRPSPEEECQWTELRARLRGFSTQLSPNLRRTFELCELQGVSVRETASILKMPVGTVKAQLSRARAKLKWMMRRSFAPQRRPLSTTWKKSRSMQVRIGVLPLTSDLLPTLGFQVHRYSQPPNPSQLQYGRVLRSTGHLWQ